MKVVFILAILGFAMAQAAIPGPEGPTELNLEIDNSKVLGGILDGITDIIKPSDKPESVRS